MSFWLRDNSARAQRHSAPATQLKMPLDRLVASSPEEVGIDAGAMEELFARVGREVSEGRVQGCQVAIARHGRVAGRASFGTASGKPVAHDTLFCCFSSTKATGGVAAWQLMEEGKLSLDQKVVDFVPEFGTNGKGVVTIEQLVTFTAGFPSPANNLADPEAFGTSAARCAEFAKWELAWEPGSRWEYHALSAHWVLMEIVERITQMDFRDYLRSKILDPMGLCDFWVGVPEDIQPDLHFADIVTFPPPADGKAGAMDSWNTSAVRALGVPAGGGQVCASDLALLYQPLVNGGKVYGGGQVRARHEPPASHPPLCPHHLHAAACDQCHAVNDCLLLTGPDWRAHACRSANQRRSRWGRHSLLTIATARI